MTILYKKIIIYRKNYIKNNYRGIIQARTIYKDIIMREIIEGKSI